MSECLTGHALVRMKQRSFNSQAIEYILQHGRMEYKTGICFYFLGERDIPASDKKLKWVQRLAGATLLVSTDQHSIITMYKNAEALHQIRRKLKYRI